MDYQAYAMNMALSLKAAEAAQAAAVAAHPACPAVLAASAALREHHKVLRTALDACAVALDLDVQPLLSAAGK